MTHDDYYDTTMFDFLWHLEENQDKLNQEMVPLKPQVMMTLPRTAKRGRSAKNQGQTCKALADRLVTAMEAF